MTIVDYANDVNKTVKEILAKCKELGFKVNSEEDILENDQITQLDGIYVLNEEEELEDLVEEIVQNENISVDDSVKKQKLKKKSDNISAKKETFATKKKEMYKNKQKLTTNNPNVSEDVILYTEAMSIADLASKLEVSAAELVKKLFMLGMMVTLNNSIDFETAELLVEEYNKKLKREETADVTNFEEFEIIDNAEDLKGRAPVVTIMGHVDHGKTTLLDTIKKTSVAAGEAGGITQAISAYQVVCNNQPITFFDTPGHAAFTEMRARGAGITDIVIIIVAADDGVMPQTKEAIDHAKAANVPIIVAINKIDKPGANIDKVKQELSDCGLMPEEWGGDTVYNLISAKEGTGIEELLENILLVSEMQEYKSNPNRYAIGTVVESRLDKQVGPIVTVLVQNGTLRLGDPLVVGHSYGKVRTLKNDKGEDIIAATPSQPVEVTGINEVPTAGDKFMAFETEKEARSIAETRKKQVNDKNTTIECATSIDDIFSKIQTGLKEINVLIKADVNGSCEAVKKSLEQIDVDSVRIKVVRSGVGAITESDVVLAKATGALIIGFNIRPNATIKEYAKENCVDIRLHNIIYKAIEEMEAAMKGMLDPTYEEKVTGSAEVRQLFKFSKVGIIAGSYVTDGLIKRDSSVRIIRDSVTIYEGKINSVQREKDTVKEVKKGLECGITIENYIDIKVGDVFETYEMVEIK